MRPSLVTTPAVRSQPVARVGRGHEVADNVGAITFSHNRACMPAANTVGLFDGRRHDAAACSAGLPAGPNLCELLRTLRGSVRDLSVSGPDVPLGAS